MRTIVVTAPLVASGPLPLLVLLPGARMSSADLVRIGFPDAVHARGFRLEIAAVEPELEDYLDDRIAARLHEEVIAPALERGASKVWIAGLSLGGYGALRYAQAFGEVLAGLILIAPFLGSKGFIDEVQAAGGIRPWSVSGARRTTPQHQLLDWLGRLPVDAPQLSRLYLGYGEEDRFARTHRLLGSMLPADQVTTLAGGHDEAVWTALWETMLDARRLGSALQGVPG